MTGKEMERAIEFLINHHAKVSSDFEGLKEAQMRTAANIDALSESVTRLEAQAEADRRDMRETFERVTEEMRDTFATVTEEMRDGFNKLILSNEVTRDLSSQVARLAIATASTSHGS